MFRPGFIKPTKGLKNAYAISRVLGTVYPILKMIFPNYVCTLEEVGVAMINASTKGCSKKILENKDISDLAQIVSTA